jgi:hypothetical protein
MTSIENLPLKVAVKILRNLDDLQDLVRARLASRHLNAAFQASFGTEAAIVGNLIPSALRPYAIAIIEARSEKHEASNLVNMLYDNPAQLDILLNKFSRKAALNMLRTHMAIQAMVKKFSGDAWARLISSNAEVTLSAAESLRFTQAFYRYECFQAIMCPNSAELSGDLPGILQRRQRRAYCFFSRHLPWENEQLVCIERFLTMNINEGK